MTTTRTLLTAALTLGLLAPASAQTLILNGKVSTEKRWSWAAKPTFR